jgi:CheY-like chemotaxis protein
VAIFMDCSMPEVDGYTAARQIGRRDGPSRHTLVIAMTAHSRTVCLAAGMGFHITKPLEIDELRADCTRLGLLARAGTLPSEPAPMSESDSPLMMLSGEGLAANAPGAEAAWTVIEQATFRLPELWRATNAADFTALRQISQELSREATVVGALRVADLCSSLANAAGEGQTAVVAAIELQLRQALADTAEAIKSQLDGTASTEASTAPHSPTRIAIADDDALARFAIETLIGAADGLALVGSAEGVDEIVELAIAQRPDVVVLDWMMPGGGGPEAARRILSRSPDTRIVALTSSDSFDARLEMARAGARDFVVKGGAPEKLTETIRHGLGAAA